MSGFFGVVSKSDCVGDVFFGTDYHSHLGTQRGGIAVINPEGFTRYIHNITNSQFRTKFDEEISTMEGNQGIGIISDYEDQPILVYSHLGTYAIVSVGSIQNTEELVKRAFKNKTTHFSEIKDRSVNPTELAATIINEEQSFTEGIQSVQEAVEGSCSVLLLTHEGIYAGRDRRGRTPIVIGKKEGSYAATLETSAFPNLDYEIEKYLGPGEIVRITADGYEQLKKPGEEMRICAFLWVYYGFPSSTYEGINVEDVRNRCGASLARNENRVVDVVAGIPDSGTAYAVGYANEANISFRRPFVKYTPTWPRSFMPQDQKIRELVAKMKLIPIRELIEGKRLLFCEDSIVRGTQLEDIIQRIFDYGAKEVHMRPACPPLINGCKYLNFSRSRSVLDLATRKAVKQLEGDEKKFLDEYTDPSSDRYINMIETIRNRLKLTSLQYQKLDDMVKAIGLPKEKLCTYCWDGVGD
ncbi:MAG: amidophosphoribosyltransferase [bacterium]